MVACATEPASTKTDATPDAQVALSRTGARAPRNSVVPLKAMPDEIVFTMHRATVVRDSAAVKGYGFPDNPVRFKDGTVPFSIVGEHSLEDHAASVAKRAGDTDAQLEGVKMKAAVDRRVEELRREAAVDRRVAELRQQAQVDGD